MAWLKRIILPGIICFGRCIRVINHHPL